MTDIPASPTSPSAIHGIVGDSPVIHRLLGTIEKIAKVDSPVLISGATGTGKELAARHVHRLSARSGKPFLVVNCSTISGSEMLSELFGFGTQLDEQDSPNRVSPIEAADGGTIYFDGIADLSADLQLSLLKFLFDGTVTKANNEPPVTLDLRVMAATNIDLSESIEDGTFREDLYYRLNVFFLEIPTLRERDNDIELIAAHYLQRFTQEQGSTIKDFTEDTKRLMNVHVWPGNVRELMNRVRRAVAMCDSRHISPQDMGLERREGTRSHHRSLAEIRAAAERTAVLASLRRNRDNIAAAARELKVSRVTLYRLLEKYQLTKS